MKKKQNAVHKLRGCQGPLLLYTILTDERAVDPSALLAIYNLIQTSIVYIALNLCCGSIM